MSDLNLLMNVHCVICEIQIPESLGKKYLVSGDYVYYHYLCDGFDDRGWGCGYRTLQTLCSWLNNNGPKVQKVPSLYEIQEILVQIEDKTPSFLGSKQWIGSFEVCLVIDKLYDVPCKILHISKGDDLKLITDKLCDHFERHGAPVMMGGDVDCSSKGIMGVFIGEYETYLLIVDPHYVGKNHTSEYLHKKGYVKWQPLKDFLSSSFYNICLPQAVSILLNK